MEHIPVAEAAQRLSISDVAVYEALRAGRLVRAPGSDPARVTLASVQRMSADRRAEAMRRRSDLCALARQADSILHAPPGSEYLPPAGSREALRALSADTFAIFGRDVLEAAASRDSILHEGGCPTCWAHMSAQVHQTHPPRDEAAYKILLGQPCAKDAQRWRAVSESNRAAMSRLRITEERARRTAEQDRARREFQAARRDAEAAASRLRSATQAMSTIDPSVVRDTTAQARRRGTFSHTPVPGYVRVSTVPPGCDCDVQHQCAAHAESDRQAALRPKPFRRPS
ncbi:hypothetical protein [Streptomyces sp. NPDC093544]|uniref:hypothetical protein n=1 Tax=Streptomyces sp. NPDC093544 TaxID=3155200 RepID=UPI00342E1EFB